MVDCHFKGLNLSGKQARIKFCKGLSHSESLREKFLFISVMRPSLLTVISIGAISTQPPTLKSFWVFASFSLYQKFLGIWSYTSPVTVVEQLKPSVTCCHCCGSPAMIGSAGFDESQSTFGVVPFNCQFISKLLLRSPVNILKSWFLLLRGNLILSGRAGSTFCPSTSALMYTMPALSIGFESLRVDRFEAKVLAAL